MKIRILSRHIREGLKNIVRNGWMSVASIAAVTTTLILVSAFLAVILNLNQIATNVEKEVQIHVLIDNTVTDSDIEDLGTELKSLKETKSISFVSKDERLNQLIEGFGDQGKSMELVEQDNPLKHEYIVKAKEPKKTEKLAKEIKKMDYVEDAIYREDTTKLLFEFNTYARAIGLVLIIGLLFTAIFLISNTIKLTIMARSHEIGIMKLVGATNNFIRWPFFMEGMFIGILGSVIPISAILIGYSFIDQTLMKSINQYFDLLPYNPFAWQLSLLVLFIGVVIGIWGSVMSIRKFLRV